MQANLTLKRFERAKKRRDQWQSILQDAYQYALPNHSPMTNAVAGARKDQSIFDDTAVTSLAQKKAKLHGQLFPAFEEWMDFSFHEDVPEAVEQSLSDWLKLAKKQFHHALEASNFHIEIDPALADACISTGALLIHEGTPMDPLRFEAVPIAELVPEEGASGKIDTVYREWKLSLRELMERWPDAQVPEQIAPKKDTDIDQPISILEAFTGSVGGGTDYQLFIIQVGTEKEIPVKILERFYKTRPLVAFRMDKAPGEWMGRGPVLSVLGDIKTANKVVELVLKNASIAVTGIWQADDDGVLNPANIQLKPGTIIPKATGSSGLTPLQSPGRFDVSQIVLEQLQENIRTGILGPQTLLDRGAGRTALEMDLRQAQQESIEIPVSLRLLSELVLPLAERILGILMSPQMAGSPYYIPPLTVSGAILKPTPKSPILRLKEQYKAQEKLNIYALAMKVMPDLVPQLIRREEVLRDVLLQSGFEAS